MHSRHVAGCFTHDTEHICIWNRCVLYILITKNGDAPFLQYLINWYSPHIPALSKQIHKTCESAAFMDKLIDKESSTIFKWNKRSHLHDPQNLADLGTTSYSQHREKKSMVAHEFQRRKAATIQGNPWRTEVTEDIIRMEDAVQCHRLLDTLHCPQRWVLQTE